MLDRAGTAENSIDHTTENHNLFSHFKYTGERLGLQLLVQCSTFNLNYCCFQFANTQGFEQEPRLWYSNLLGRDGAGRCGYNQGITNLGQAHDFMTFLIFKNSFMHGCVYPNRCNINNRYTP